MPEVPILKKKVYFYNTESNYMTNKNGIDFMKKTDLRFAILKQLMQNGETTRPELVELTGIRAATVFEAVDALKGFFP